MPLTADELLRSPNPLAPDYSRFRVAERLLLTGHSHQAWPDRGFDGQVQAWLDAARWVDEKWDQAFSQAERVRRGYARLLGDEDHDDCGDGKNRDDGSIALAASTHDLVIRFLSALPLANRPRLLTTDGEYHTIRRQLDRLSEEGVAVDRVAADPATTVAERLAAALDDRTAAVLVSAVFYQSARIVPHLGDLLQSCLARDIPLLVDAYHALSVIPFSLKREGLAEAYVVGGGYKYCQLGEGNAFLRFPRDCAMRPVITGWFSEFDALAQSAPGSRVTYGEGPARFGGATYDPSSHYRAAAVFDYFEEKGLTPSLLRRVSQHQVGQLIELFDGLDADPHVISRDRDVPLAARAGFFTLHSPHAAWLCARLRERDVLTDYRGQTLRLGPAPYLSDDQLGGSMAILGAILTEPSTPF